MITIRTTVFTKLFHGIFQLLILGINSMSKSMVLQLKRWYYCIFQCTVYTVLNT